MIIRQVYSDSSEITFPVERLRIQFVTLLLIMAYTTSRPGALVDETLKNGNPQCVTYGDLQFRIIPDPSNASKRVLVMLMSLRFVKARRGKNP